MKNHLAIALLCLPACALDLAPELDVGDVGAELGHRPLPVSHSERWPAVARSGGRSLVAWMSDDLGARDIYAARFDAEGIRLDDAPLRLAGSDATERSPAVAASASDFLVLWHDGGTERGVYGRRVAFDGTLRDRRPIPVAAGNTQFAAAASDGRDFLAVWVGPGVSGGTRVNAAIVTADAEVSPRISLGVSGANTPAVAYADGAYLVTWTDARTGRGGVYAQHLDRSGAPVGDELAIATDGDATWPAVSAGRDGFSVRWQHRDFDSGAVELRGARVPFAGADLRDMAAVPARFVWGSGMAAAGGVVATGELSADFSQREVRVYDGDGNAIALDVAPSIAAAGGSPVLDDARVAMAWSKGAATVAWQHYEDGVFGIRVQAVDGDATPLWSEAIDPLAPPRLLSPIYTLR